MPRNGHLDASSGGVRTESMNEDGLWVNLS